MSNDQPLVIFTPSGKRGHVPKGTTILQAARKLGVDLDSVCGGRGICSKCQCAPSFGKFDKHGITSSEAALSEWNEVEARYDRIRGLKEGRRLGCQAQILDDVVLDVPPESQMHKQIVRKSLDTTKVELDPLLRVEIVELAEATLDEVEGDAERLRAALLARGIQTHKLSLTALAELQPALQKGRGKISVLYHQASVDATANIIAIWPGIYEGKIAGVAIDLGSTTIAAHIIDLQTGDALASGGVMNPQIRFGEDLMSRVSYAMMNPGGGAEMTHAVRDGLNGLIGQLAVEAEIARSEIFDLTIVGNPVMHHLLLGIDPTPLGQAPFPLSTSQSVDIAAKELEIEIHPQGRVYILPLIAGHVGADAAAVAYAVAPHLRDELTLVCDVGTNAEILLGDKKGLLACSSPTGPAFEGAQISSGQRAANGAIERAEIDPITKDVRFRIIGDELWSDDPEFDAEVTGICGSGIIELVAEMRMAGIVDANGLIGSPDAVGSARIIEDGRTYSYTVWDGREKGGPLITVTNKDVREIQLAKAALYAGAKLLMDKRGVDHVDRVVLAGAFGAHISSKHAMVLGMIPDCDLDHVTSAGNAAGTGARTALLNRVARTEVEALVRTIDKIETAVEPRFQEHFVAATNIPNSADGFEKLRAHTPLPNVNFNTGGNDESGGRRRRRRES